MLKRGFWGDIVNSPYTAFGVAAEAPDAARLFRLRNREHVFTAVDVAAHNVTARRACDCGGMAWRGAHATPTLSLASVAHSRAAHGRAVPHAAAAAG